MIDVDLQLCPLAFALLSEVPEEERYGPLVIDERVGRPYAHLVYGHEWRKVADKAGVPRTVFSMDARSGGATEADEAGASLDDIRRTMAHTDAKTTLRYVRGRGLPQARRVAEARVAHRARKAE